MKKVYIQVDDNNIVRCVATERCNLHKDKSDMKTYHVEFGGRIGDEYDAEKDTWTARPENYPKPPELSDEEKKQKLIKEKIEQLALAELTKEGKLDNEGNLK
jgi:hypothetical protein